MRSRFESLLAAVIGAALVATVTGLFFQRTEAAYIPVPSGAILYFNAATCPTGWTEFTGARGAYIVGRVSGGTLATLVGTALTDLENRPAGSHNHAITDPGHFHTANNSAGAGGGINVIDQILTNQNSAPVSGALVNANTTGVTINAGGGGTSGQTGVTGTNAPYLELLVCKKS